MLVTERLPDNGGSDFIVGMMCDSSPMFGRDWFIARYELFVLDILLCAFDLLCQIHALIIRQDASHSVEMLQTGFAELIAECHTVHASLPTSLGSKHASIAHKFHCLLHGLAVELGWKLVEPL